MEVLYQWTPQHEQLQSEEENVKWWIVTESSDRQEAYDLLLVCDKSVKWFKGLCHEGNVLQVKYSVESSILQVLWVTFEESGKCLCVREKRQLTLFMMNGARYYIPLPFEVQSLWSIKGSLLLERKGGEIDDHLAVLFTISHPLDDVCPVTSRRPSFIKDSSGGSLLAYMTSPQLHVVAVCHDHTPPMIVTYDTRDNTHTLWAIQPATSNDIPSPGSTPGPAGGMILTARTPGGPLSSSAPARYIHQSPTSAIKFSLHIEPSPTLSLTDKGKSLLDDSFKGSAFKRLKHKGTSSSPFGYTPSPVLKVKGQHHKGVGGVTDSGKIVSGRSPFINRYVTPKTTGKAKPSRSPQLHYARISPHSQAISSWNTLFNEQSMIDPFEFLLPQVCLHQIWTELPENEAMIDHSCCDAFVTCDFSGEELLCLHISSLNQLRFLPLSKITMDDSISANDIPIITNVHQVINFIELKLLLVLTLEGQLFIYTGFRKVTDKVSINLDGYTIQSIRDPIAGSEFTIVRSDGKCYQCSIHQLPAGHSTISLCLQSLSCCLPSDVLTQLMIAYYNYSSTDKNGNEDVWNRFEAWLLACMGGLSNNHKTRRPIDPLLARDPVLKLLGKVLTEDREREEQIIINDNFIIPLEGHMSCITSGLHLVYEELKLNVHLKGQLLQLGSLLYTLTSHLGWQHYMDHYWRDIPSLIDHTPHRVESFDAMEDKMLYTRTTPPNIFQTIYDVFERRKITPYPLLSVVCKRTQQIMKIYTSLIQYWDTIAEKSLYETIGEVYNSTTNNNNNNNNNIKRISDDDHLIHVLTEEGFTMSDMESYPIGISLPILVSLFHYRSHPKSTWSSRVYQLIGREDIGRTLYDKKQELDIKYELSITNDDGMSFDEEVLKVRFPADLRVKEVKRLLSSTEPVRIALEQKPEVSDHEFVEEQENLLLNLSQRTMSLPVGRGMFTLATVHPLPTAPLYIPALNLTGRVPPRNATVSLDGVDKPDNMTDWPQFHNGVAAGLKIAPGISKLDSTWIVFNQPSEEQGVNEYAGFLMALGLNGHLTSLSTYNKFEYLQDKHELIVIAVLLGTSVSMCGSMDRSTASTFSIFFPPLLPPDSADLETSILMQTAASLSLGLLYMGSCNRYMMETMLNQIGHSPGPELKFGSNRESYSLCAGLALGMIGINSGGSSIIDGFNLVDQLCVYINGGSKRDVKANDTSSTSHLVLEGSQVNVHVTAPGAILALGLIYLKTNDRQIATHLAPPTTAYQFECVNVRPDFLSLRALASGLILWDEIVPTQDWISHQIPQITHQYAFCYGTPLAQVMSQSFLYITAGCSLAIGLKFGGSGSLEAYDCLLYQYKMIMSHQSEQVSKYCVDTCVQTLLLSLSLVMSGSGDLGILRLIRRHHTQQSSDSLYGHQMATHMALGLLFLGGGRYCVSNSNKAIAALVCSLYPHFPSSSTDNRYHLQALRHLYVLGIEPRVLMTRDYATDQLCSVPIQLHCQNDGGDVVLVEKKTPCLLPNWNQLIKIEVMGPRYWSVIYELESFKERLIKTGTIYVKRHSGYSSYENDPLGQKSVLSLSVLSPSQYQLGGINGKLHIPPEALRDDPFVKEFYTHLCDDNQLYSALLLDCINREQLELLRYYLRLEESCNHKSIEEISTIDVWQAKLCNSFVTRNNTCLQTMKDYTGRLLMSLDYTIGKEKDTDGLFDMMYSYLTDSSHHHMPSPVQLKRLSSLLSLILILSDIPYTTHPSDEIDKMIKKFRNEKNMTPLTVANIIAFILQQSNKLITE